MVGGGWYVVGGMFCARVVEGDVLDRVGGADDLGEAVLALGGPHGEAGEEAAVAELELAQRVRDIAPLPVFSKSRAGRPIVAALRRKLLQSRHDGVLLRCCHFCCWSWSGGWS